MPKIISYAVILRERRDRRIQTLRYAQGDKYEKTFENRYKFLVGGKMEWKKFLPAGGRWEGQPLAGRLEISYIFKESYEELS